MEKKTKVSSDKEKETKNIQSKDKKIEKLKVKDGKKEDGAGSDSGKETKKIIKTTTVKDMLRAQRDSKRNIIDGGGNKSEHTEDSEKDTASSDESSNSSSDERSDSKKDSINGIQKEVKLPENIPAELILNINKMKEASKANSGKSNFFDSVNIDLLFK